MTLDQAKTQVQNAALPQALLEIANETIQRIEVLNKVR